MNYSIKHCNWQSQSQHLQAIRTSVFIEEQGVPVARERDALDDSAQHWLAVDGDERPLGTIRMLNDGHIGRMAVLKEARGRGIGGALLSAAVNYAKDQSLFDVYLHAQSHALAFYRGAGFEPYGDEFLDAGINHQAMRLQLALRRLLGIHGGTFNVEHFPSSLSDLIDQCDNNLRLYSATLDKRLFGSEAIIQSVSALARKHRHSTVHILVADTSDIVNRGHALLELQRRLPSKIAIKTLATEALLPKQDIAVADHRGYLCHTASEKPKSWGDYRDLPGAKVAIDEFDRLWERALIDRNLQQLGL